MAANVPIYIDQGGAQMTVGEEATLTVLGNLVVDGDILPTPDSITTAMLQDDCVTTDKIDDGAVTNDKLEAQAVTSNKIYDFAVGTQQLANAAVTVATSNVFISTEQTGNGMAQNVAHGLGVTPALVLVVPSDTSGTMSPGDFTITFTKGNTNVVVTATPDLKYYVMAWA